MLKANVKITGNLEEFTRMQLGESGLYETASEYVRDLIRRDMERKETAAWDGLRHELLSGMDAKQTDFISVTAQDVIKRNRQV